MKIIFVNRFTYPDTSATSQMLTDLAAELARDGYEVHAIASRQLYDNSTSQLSAYQRHRGFEIHRVAGTRFGRGRLPGRLLDYLSFYIFATWGVFSLARNGDIVILKTDPPLLSVLGLIAVKARSALLINWLQDLYPEVAVNLGALKPGLVARFLSTLRDASLRKAALNVVIGPSMRRLLIERLRTQNAIVQIPNWPHDSNGAAASEELDAFRSEAGIGSRLTVMYSGNLGRAHEYKPILEAAEQLRKRKDVAFVMIGGGSGMTALHEAVAMANLTNFIFLPYQPRERLHVTLAAADVHLISLRPDMEGLIVPSKLYGILAAGRPFIFIGSGESEIAHLGRTGDCGIQVDSSGSSLAHAILSLSDKPSERERMGRNAKQLAQEEFTFARSAQKWKDAIIAVRRESGSAP